MNKQNCSGTMRIRHLRRPIKILNYVLYVHVHTNNFKIPSVTITGLFFYFDLKISFRLMGFVLPGKYS